MKLTALGKELRILRMDENILLGDMADALSISSSMLSGIEYGRKRPTLELGEKIVDYLNLDQNKSERLLQILSREIDTFAITPANDVEREAMVLFARHLSTMDENALEKIRNILIKNTGGN